MAKGFPKLEMEKVLQIDAAEIVAARTKGQLIHQTQDIDTAGNEVEQAVRRVLRIRLSQRYYVGHGHIVDSHESASPQLDVIVADNAGSAVLFEAQDGTQYFPYESVYAIGEVKATYYKSKNPIHEFVDLLDATDSTLQRDRISPEDGSRRLSPKTFDKSHGSSNPLFSFMLFVNSNGFALEHIEDLYRDKAPTALPNVLCFLDEGCVCFKQEGEWSTGPGYSFYSTHPGFPNEVNLVAHSRQKGHWYLERFGTEENTLGANLGFLYSLLSSFLKQASLGEPDMSKYLAKMFIVRESERLG